MHWRHMLPGAWTLRGDGPGAATWSEALLGLVGGLGARQASTARVTRAFA